MSAEIHNITDIRKIQFLGSQLDNIRLVLVRCGNWDPTESYADLIEDLRTTGILLTSELSLRRREISYLKSHIQALELEITNEKAVARSYPLSDPVDFGGFSTSSGYVGGNKA